MEREEERRNKLNAINKKSKKIKQIKNKIKDRTLTKDDPEYSTAIELDLFNKIKEEKQKELNDLVKYIEEGNKTQGSDKKQSGGKKKKKKK